MPDVRITNATDIVEVTTDNELLVKSNNDIHEKTLVKKTLDWSSSQTLTSLWTPTTGKKFVLCDVVISFDDTGDGSLILVDNTDTTANRIMKVYPLANGGIAMPYKKPIESSTANNVLKITISASTGGSITVSGYEI